MINAWIPFLPNATVSSSYIELSSTSCTRRSEYSWTFCSLETIRCKRSLSMACRLIRSCCFDSVFWSRPFTSANLDSNSGNCNKFSLRVVCLCSRSPISFWRVSNLSRVSWSNSCSLGKDSVALVRLRYNSSYTPRDFISSRVRACTSAE